MNTQQLKKLTKGIEKGISAKQMATYFKVHERWLQRFIKKDPDCQIAKNRYEAMVQNWFES